MKRVNIIQRSFFTYAEWAHRFSNSIVLLLDHNDKTIVTYRNWDASQLQSIDISYTDFRTTYGASAYSVWRSMMQKVKVIARDNTRVSFSEVEVFNTLDSNVALGKSATQSSTHLDDYTRKAVNGIYNNFTHTGDN